MDIRHLRVFVAVAETRSFRRASELLNIAQPALTRTVQQLEAFIGTPLLNRTTRFVELTECGEYVFERSRGIIADVGATLEAARRIGRGERGEVFVGVNDFTIADTVPPVLGRFRALKPGIKINLVAEDSLQMMGMVADRRLDIAFLSGAAIPAGLCGEVLREEEFVAVLPLDHALATKPDFTLSDLAGAEFVMGEPSWHVFLGPVEAFCRAAGFSPNIVHRALGSDAIINVVAAGLGVTIYVDRAILRRRDDIVVRPLGRPAEPFRSLAVWRDEPLASPVSELVRAIRPIDAHGASSDAAAAPQ